MKEFFYKLVVLLILVTMVQCTVSDSSENDCINGTLVDTNCECDHLFVGKTCNQEINEWLGTWKARELFKDSISDISFRIDMIELNRTVVFKNLSDTTMNLNVFYSDLSGGPFTYQFVFFDPVVRKGVEYDLGSSDGHLTNGEQSIAFFLQLIDSTGVEEFAEYTLTR